jgi:hypothetical protein
MARLGGDYSAEIAPIMLKIVDNYYDTVYIMHKMKSFYMENSG